MTTTTTPDTPPATNESTASAPRSKKRAWSQEKMMLAMALLFFAGVALFTLVPEDTPLRGVIMPLYVGVMCFLIYRFTTPN